MLSPNIEKITLLLCPNIEKITLPFSYFQRNVKFPLSAASCSKEDWLAIMVLTMPRNRHLRNNWRRYVKDRRGVRVFFMTSQTTSDEDQNILDAESDEEGDIVQCGMEDGHRRLGYKILCGHIWSFLHCPNVKHVAQTDDSIELDMDKLFNKLDDNKTDWENLITCPSMSFGIKVARTSSAVMAGRWSFTREEYAPDYFPEYCNGWLYITTPSVGAQLAQVRNIRSIVLL